MKSNKLTFQFLSEPTDVNFGGKVHGGIVMRWIDQTAFACARSWAESYCVTIYVSSIRFYKPIHIGEIVRVDATIIYTGRTSIHIAVDVFSKSLENHRFEKKTHCIIVFVSVDAEGKPMAVPTWKPKTKRDKQMEEYAVKLMELRKDIEQEMSKFL